jgi:hypothetical protein
MTKPGVLIEDLDHEDAGMMANVMLVNDRLHQPPPAKVTMPTHYHMTHR